MKILKMAAIVGLILGATLYSQAGKIKDAAKKEKAKKETVVTDAKFKAGDKVEVQLGGTWYAGTIKGVTPGKPYRVELQYPPGGFKDIKESDIREVVASTAGADGQFKVGDVAEGYDAGAWYKVDILKAESGRFFVHWHGYGSDADVWIGRGKLRAVGSNAAYSGEFKAGEKVDVLGRTMWLEATVLEYLPGKSMYKVQETVSGEIWNATENPVRIRAFSGAVEFNFSGKNFKAGQYVRVWHSGNDSLNAKIAEVKGNQILIGEAGTGQRWISVDAPELRNDTRTASIAASAGMQDAFFAECGKYTDAISAFASLYSTQYNTQLFMYNQGLAPPRASELAKFLKDLDELDIIIKTKYPNIQNTETTWTTELSKNPGTWRIICEKRKELAKSMAAAEFKEKFDWELDQARNIRKKQLAQSDYGIWRTNYLDDLLDNNGQKGIVEIQARLKPVIEAAKAAGAYDAKVEDELYTTLRTQVAEVKAGFSAALKAESYKALYKDADAESKAIARVKKDYPGSVILKSGIEKADWYMSSGRRGKNVGVFFKTPQGRCVTSYIDYWQDQTLGGFGPGYISTGVLNQYYTLCQ